MSSNNKLLFITMILLAMTLIPLGDTAGKLLMQQGVTPIYVAWSRFVIGALCLLPFSGLRLSELRHFLDWRLLIRAALFIAAVSSILTAVKTESIANVFGAFFIGPILSYFIAAIFLKEPITFTRSILLFVGFGGALLVIKPGFGMSTGMGYAALAGTFYGFFLVTNRWLAGTFRPRLILISTLVIGSIVLAPFGVKEMPDLNMNLSLLILLSSLSSAIGNLLIIEASRQLPASVIAPFVYIQLVAATFFGVVVFNTWPDQLSLIGLITLIMAGMSSFLIANREKKRLQKDIA